jgi:glyoxylase-like metal-dependent hydrolase (beta-lactamase superfamily II)
MFCRIGEVEVWRILEWQGLFLPPARLFPNAPDHVAEIVEDLAPGSVDSRTGRLILPVQAFLLKSRGRTILVDTGIGNHKRADFPPWAGRDDDRFMAGLTAAGVTPDEIDVVFCTHLHGDHVGWNTRLERGRWVPTFPTARYFLPAEGRALFGADPSDMFAQSVLPVVGAGQAKFVSGSHEIAPGLTRWPTPGHTPGHACLLIESGEARAIIAADAFHSSAQCRHPDWHFRFDADPRQAVASRRRLLDLAADTGAEIIGSHVVLPSRGRVSRDGDVFAWHPSA